MAREMIEPSGALDSVVKENIRPMSVVLLAIMEDLLGGQADERTKRLCGMSVVSQVLFYHHCRPAVMRVFPELKFDESTIETLADHITAFSLAGIKELAKKNRRK